RHMDEIAKYEAGFDQAVHLLALSSARRSKSMYHPKNVAKFDSWKKVIAWSMNGEQMLSLPSAANSIVVEIVAVTTAIIITIASTKNTT
ncbi:MAG: hypothetical protein AAFV92_02295, partial [Pseudomonadota bacterium]